MLLRLAYLGVTNLVALLRLLPRSDREKDTEILVLRHQLSLLRAFTARHHDLLVHHVHLNHGPDDGTELGANS